MVEIELCKRDGSDPLTINDDAIQSLNATLTNTGVGTFRATLKGDRRLERRAQRQDRVNIKTDDTKFAGYLLACPHTRSDGTTQIRGKGIAKQLQEGRPSTRPITYDNEFAGDAIEDYWSRTPFGNVTVTKQSSNIVVQDSVEQSADTTSEWQNALESIADDEPLEIRNGVVDTLQTGFVGDEGDLSGPQVSDVDYTAGEARAIEGTGSGDIAYSFTTEYDVPSSRAKIYLRGEEGSGTGTPVTVNLKFDGATIASDTILFTNKSLEWKEFDIGSDVNAGSHTITIEFSQANDNVKQIFDILMFGDGDYYTVGNFDNTVDSDNGHLDNPALFAANPIIKTTNSETTRNIANADVTTTFDDTNNDQRIGVSNDNGANFVRGDNTNSLSAAFTTAGRELVTEFRLSGYDNGARNATPRFNYLGQEIDSFETKVDLDDRVVFIGVEVSKNHFENLQKLHDNSDYVWTIEHDSSDVANMPVFSFPRGEETRTLNQINENEIDESPSVEAEQFYNVIPLEGGLNGGTRPFVEVKDQDSINDIGEEISPGLLRDPTISSDIEAEFIARALLRKALKNGELRGAKTIPPTFAPTPGFAYLVSWLDDPTTEVTLEEVSVTKSTGSAQTTLDFTGRTGFAQQIDELRRQARETQDEI